MKKKKKYGIFHRRSGPPPPHEKYGKIQPIFFKLLTTYGGLFEKKYFFPLKKLELYLFQIYYREGGCTKWKKIFFAFLDELRHFQQLLKKYGKSKNFNPAPPIRWKIPYFFFFSILTGSLRVLTLLTDVKSLQSEVS